MEPPSRRTHYDILQVQPQASPSVIQGAWRALLKDARRHPDLGGSEDGAREINQAYAVLRDPLARRDYDQRLALEAGDGGRFQRTEYILICPYCRARNRLRPDYPVERARCGACRGALVGRPGAPAQPDDGRAFRLGMFLLDKGLFDRALREFQTAVRLHPEDARYQYWLGRCLYRKRLLKSARAVFRRVTSIRPEQFQFQFWLAQTCYALKDYGEAIGGFTAAAILRPRHTPTLVRLGSCYYRVQDYSKALRLFRAAVRLEPNRDSHHTWLGMALLAHRNAKAALRSFEKADLLSPGKPLNRRYLELCRATLP